MKDKRNAPLDDLTTDDAPAESADPVTTSQGDGIAEAPEVETGPAADGGDARTSQLAAELEQQKDKYVRLLAEFDNFRRRSVRDRQEAEQRGMGNLVRGLLETLDNLARVAHVDPSKTDAKTMVDGVAMVEKTLMKSLAGHGLELIDPAGKPFDPALHEAISTAPAPDAASDHMVAQVFQVGYVFNGTLLRPARVVVQQWNG